MTLAVVKNIRTIKNMLSSVLVSCQFKIILFDSCVIRDRRSQPVVRYDSYTLDYSMSDKLLTEHHLEFLSLIEVCTGSSESILIKMPHCWKSHGSNVFEKFIFYNSCCQHNLERIGYTHLDLGKSGYNAYQRHGSFVVEK